MYLKNKILNIIPIILIVFALNVNVEFADAKENHIINENVVLISENGADVVIYKDAAAEIELVTVESGTNARIIDDQFVDFIKISVMYEKEEVEGYVSSKNITYLPEETDINIDTNEDTDVNEVTAKNEKQHSQKVSSVSTAEKEPKKITAIDSEVNLVNQASIQSMTLYGIALKNKTNVYEKTSTTAKVLKSYDIGSTLKYETYNDNWYKAKVKVNGKYVQGYINKHDVDTFVENKGKTYNSYGIKHPTNVYASPSTNSKVLKSYNYGHLLKYRALSENWYEATVYIAGKPQTGYISKNDLRDNLPALEQGYAQTKLTNVYESTSKDSRILKSYFAGQLLKFRPYNDTWYIATVYLNGKPHVGFIHKNDVGDEINKLSGYAQLKDTNVYKSTSKSSKILKSYPVGKILLYQPYNEEWYKATVYLSGKAYTGYIYKNDVGTKPPTMQGYAQLEPTNIYQSTSMGSNVLKSYRAGHILKFKPYNDTWYEVTVYINGSPRTGYLHKDAVGDNIPTLHGLALKQPTSVYSSTSQSSKVLKSYRKDSLLKFRPHNGSWYKATVYINGKSHTGYIHRSDVVISTGKVVVIDAGHGGHDPGATGNGLLEKNINLDIAKRVEKLLKDSGFIVNMTRTNDQYLSLQERSSLANRVNADLFVSIHVNAGGGTGIETWWYSKGPEPEKSQLLAKQIQKEVIKQTGVKDRGVKNGNLHVNRETNMPSSLIEVGFIDNKNDAEKLKNNSFKDLVAKGIVNGIKIFFQIFK